MINVAAAASKVIMVLLKMTFVATATMNTTISRMINDHNQNIL